MSDKRRYVVYGNTAVKYEAVPVQPERKRAGEPARKQPETQQPGTKRKPESRPGSRAGNSDRSWIDEMKYAAFICFAVAIGVVMCVALLKANVAYRNEKNNVKKLQNQLTEQLNLNAQYSARLDGAVDLDQIYSIATEELGMVYSEPGQTVYYDKNNEDYAIQYKDVPEAN